MQFSTLAVALFAALATARSHGHPRFQHRRGLNESTAIESSTAVDLTTLTVQITSTHTVIGCAQNVTSCPARDATAIRTVTEVVDLTTTVCPVASASDISSSVIASAVQTPGAITSTEAAQPVQTSDSVLTYTLGSGASQSIVTTTIKHTVTGYVTKTMTKSNSAQPTPVAGSGNNANGGGDANVGGNDKGNGSGSGNANGNSGEPTTTIRTTTTATRTFTVKPSTSAGPGTGSFIGSPNGEGSNSGSGGNAGDCAAPVTVTVALSTVTVTYNPAAPTGTVPSVPDAVVPGKEAVKTTAASEASPEAPSTTAEPTNGGAGEVPVTVVTVPVIPVPYKNSTETATKHHSYHHSSGFLTAPRPTGTGSSIQPARTGWF